MKFTRGDTVKFVQHLESYYMEPIVPREAAYSEEISTYKNHIERSLSVRTNSTRELCVDLICYTNMSDANWIELTERTSYEAFNFFAKRLPIYMYLTNNYRNIK